MFKLKRERINFKKKIGSGASGTVYPYQKDADDLKWVVKRMHADDSDKLLSYLPEIVLGFSCDHPCILPLKGYSAEKLDQEGYYIYLKFPRMKETLKDRFDAQKKNNKSFLEKELVKYFYSMVCGVEYLHKKKIYHRDIKPGNMLLDEKGSLMLSDVGFAKHVGDEEIYQPLTGQGGTVDYTAPELLKDKSKLTKGNLIAGDAWSLGLVMLELCVLKNRLLNPYLGQEKIEEIQKSLYDQLKEIYSKTLLDLIFKLLKFEPNERIKIMDLKQILEAESKYCCLNSENEEIENNDEIENMNSPIEKDKNSDQNATQEMTELVENLLRENSKLQSQLKEHISFFNQFQSEMLTELHQPDHEAVKRLLVDYQDSFNKFTNSEGIQKRQNEESLLDRNEINQNFDREEKKESQDSISKSQAIVLPGGIPSKNQFQDKPIPEAKSLDCIKIVFLGYDAGGKTSVIRRLHSNTFSEADIPTIGGSFCQLIGNREKKKLLLNIWDTSSEERFQSKLGVGMYLKGSLVVVILYEISRRISFERIPRWINLAKECIEGPFILFIVGNKLDLESEQEVSQEEAKEFARKYGATHLEVSAKTGQNTIELRQKFEDVAWQKYEEAIVRSNSIQEKKNFSFWNFFG